jgi:hypothetical protein
MPVLYFLFACLALGFLILAGTLWLVHWVWPLVAVTAIVLVLYQFTYVNWRAERKTILLIGTILLVMFLPALGVILWLAANAP